MTAMSRSLGLPQSPTAVGVLFLALPLEQTQTKLCKAFVVKGIPFEQRSPAILAISLQVGRLEQIVSALADCLGETERIETRALLLQDHEEPTLSDLMSTQSAASLMSGVQERWLVEMLKDRRLTTHFQPIVSFQDPGKIHAYECLLRGKAADGVLVAPTRMYDVARKAELIAQLDRAARLTSIQEAMAHGIREHLFINFNPSSIHDPMFCLEGTISAIEKAGIDPGRIVFEVVESDKVEFDLLGIMATYRKAGFLVALDDLGAGYGSLNLLSSLRPDIIKLDMRLVRDVDRDRYKAGISSKLLEMARKLEIVTVAEGIESAGEFEWFRDHGADFAQGYYIARPASPPPKLAWSTVVRPN